MAEAREGDRGSGAAPFDQRLVKSQRAEGHAGHHISGEDAGRGQLGLVDEDLTDGADQPAAEERVEIFHKTASQWNLPTVFPSGGKLCGQGAGSSPAPVLGEE